MSFLEGIINHKKNEIWDRLAKEIGGEVSEKFWSRDRMYTHYKNWVSMLDMLEKPGYQFGGYQTRLNIPTVVTKDFYFEISKPGFFSKIFDKYDTEIVKIEDETFDKNFNIHISDKNHFKGLITKETTHLIWDLRPISIDFYCSIIDKEGEDSLGYLSIRKEGRITNFDQLKSMFHLKELVLDNLLKEGIITTEATRIDTVKILENMIG